jgi:hypothetical protein
MRFAAIPLNPIQATQPKEPSHEHNTHCPPCGHRLTRPG